MAENGVTTPKIQLTLQVFPLRFIAPVALLMTLDIFLGLASFLFFPVYYHYFLRSWRYVPGNTFFGMYVQGINEENLTILAEAVETGMDIDILIPESVDPAAGRALLGTLSGILRRDHSTTNIIYTSDVTMTEVRRAETSDYEAPSLAELHTEPAPPQPETTAQPEAVTKGRRKINLD